MPFTESQLKKIRRILPKNLRQIIAAKCAQNGAIVSVRQVSLVLANDSSDQELIISVTNAITELIREKKEFERTAKEKIDAELL